MREYETVYCPIMSWKLVFYFIMSSDCGSIISNERHLTVWNILKCICKYKSNVFILEQTTSPTCWFYGPFMLSICWVVMIYIYISLLISFSLYIYRVRLNHVLCFATTLRWVDKTTDSWVMQVEICEKLWLLVFLLNETSNQVHK